MLSDEIRAAVDRHSIVEVLQQLGVEPPARWNGSSDFMLSCPSPTHEDSTPSCIVHTQTDRYYCFGCGVHGDVLQLVQDVTGIRSIREAVDVLEGGSIRPNVTPQRTVARAVHRTDVDLQRTSLERVLAVNEAAWQELTRPSAVRIADGYLAHRGLDVSRLNELLVGAVAGYTPSGADGLLSRLRTRGFREVEIVDAGWALRTRSGDFIDRFRRRVLFPYMDDDGHLLGVIGRDTTGHARQKYINTPSTVVFRKSAVLYEPRRVCMSNGIVVVCEGPLDALAVAASSAELRLRTARVVAVSGTALTAAHASSLKDAGVHHAVLFPDADAPGEAARCRWRKVCEGVGLTTSDARVPEGRDPLGWIPGRLCATLGSTPATSVRSERWLVDLLADRQYLGISQA